MWLNFAAVCRQDRSLGRAVRDELIGVLYASQASMAIGAALGCATAVATAYYCRTFWIYVAGSLLASCGAFRVLSCGLFRPGSSNANMRRWELLYEAGALGYAGFLGLLTGLVLITSHDPKLHMMMGILATGYGAGAAGRNTGKPFIAIGQLLLCCLPLVAGLVTDPTPINLLIALATFLFAIVIIDVTLLTYQTVLKAFIERQEKLALAEGFEKISKTDQLTGIDNRRTLCETLEHVLDQRDTKVAVLWLDLDQFKQINDTMGHVVGDEVLRHVALKIGEQAFDALSVARFGGDEFILVVRVEDLAHAMTFAEAVRGAVGKPIGSGQSLKDVTASIGVAVSAPGISAEDLLRHADVALYESKAKGRNCVTLFDPEMGRQMLDRKTIEHDLKQAIVRGQLQLAFQPIVQTGSRRVESFEALLRWHHPTRGEIPPDVFIPIAENIGVIEDLTRWVLLDACASARDWPDSISVAVNISALLLRGHELPTLVTDALRISGLHANRLELEITESAIVEDNVNATILLEELQGLGLRVSLDDFGTGYSSLSYLCRYRFDRIKIDRSFISSADHKLEARAVVEGIASLAKSLNLSVVAEGIETLEQQRYISQLGIELAQGYFLAYPMPRSLINDYLLTTPNGTRHHSGKAPFTPLRAVV